MAQPARHPVGHRLSSVAAPIRRHALQSGMYRSKTIVFRGLRMLQNVILEILQRYPINPNPFAAMISRYCPVISGIPFSIPRFFREGPHLLRHARQTLRIS